MKREGFSYRRPTTKKKKSLTTTETIETLTDFLLITRVFQLSTPNFPEIQVYNRDQVPMALAVQYASTIDDKNKEVICDATYDSTDVKRFCTLNLTIPMLVEKDLCNLVKSHVVSKATRFVRVRIRIKGMNMVCWRESCKILVSTCLSRRMRG